MAYIANNLTPIFVGGGGFCKRWSYCTTDSLVTVAASGYFNSAAAQMTIGDIVEITIVDAVAASSRTSVTGSFELLIATNDLTTVTTTQASLINNTPINTTATTLTITAASHANRMVTISSAAPIAITLPQATGSGSKYKFQVQVVATATSHTIKVANATDVMQGFVVALTTSSANIIGYGTSATSDTISLNGTTLGGVVGDIVEIEDVKTGFFSVKLFTSPTGSTATPFSATV